MNHEQQGTGYDPHAPEHEQVGPDTHHWNRAPLVRVLPAERVRKRIMHETGLASGPGYMHRGILVAGAQARNLAAKGRK